jgi:hypothetical protein
LQYAESHYKFRFPTSPLFKREPELLCDAPFQVVPGEACPLWLVAHDAHLFPVRLHSIDCAWERPGESVPFTLDCEQNLNEPFHFLQFFLPEPPHKGAWTLRTKMRYTLLRKNKWKETDRWNYPMPPEPLRIDFLELPLPKPAGWLAGETHCHTWYSSSQVEFGASPVVLQGAAKACGLDYVFITDHSYDFAWKNSDYMHPTDPEEQFNLLVKEIHELPPYPHLIAGEEVSCGNSRGENVHLLVLGNQSYIHGQGDGGRRWFNYKPDHSIADVVGLADGAPCFAAHPKMRMGYLERKILNRGTWHKNDMTSGIWGLQFWDGVRDFGFEKGRRFWIHELLDGHYLLPLAGSDAHGDLNHYIGMKTPLISLRENREHIFGFVRTVIPEMKMLRQGPLYLTEGPALWFEGGVLRAQTNRELGGFAFVKLFGAKKGDTQETEIALAVGEDLEHEWKTDAWSDFAYVRAECETKHGRFAMTSAKQYL